MTSSLPVLATVVCLSVAAQRVGTETVTCVSNIYKYYVAYRLVVIESQAHSPTGK
jgi:hypothetical protein